MITSNNKMKNYIINLMSIKIKIINFIQQLNEIKTLRKIKNSTNIAIHFKYKIHKM